MKTIYFLKGLPASGKSTWAREQLAKYPQTKRVNKDDLRAMLDNSKWGKYNEKFVIKVRDYIIREALADGLHVIVDDTNLHPKHEINIRRIAKEFNAKMEIKFFDTPVWECIERDKKRDNPVGENVIISMNDNFVETDLSKIPMKKIWVISDTHFTHQMLIDEKVRPKDYNEQIMENWNSLVGKEDLVIHLGDVIFGYKKERLKDILSKLNGNKVLVKGNHDLKPDVWYLEMGFEHVYNHATYGDIIFTHIPIEIPSKYRYNIHGHLHGGTGHRFEEVKDILTKKHILISLENTGYKPIKLYDLMNDSARIKRNIKQVLRTGA